MSSAGQTLAPVLSWISTLVRLVLGGVFVSAGALKVIDPQASIQSVQAYALLPSAWETAVGWGLPFVELVLGLLLIAGLFTRAVAGIATGLLAVFIAAVLSAAGRGLNIDCGCFGGGGEVAAGETHYPLEVLRDVGFLVLAVWLLRFPRSRLGLDPDSRQ